MLKPKETEKLSQPRVHLHNYMVLSCFRKTLANTAMRSGGQGNAGEQPWHCAHGAMAMGSRNHRESPVCRDCCPMGTEPEQQRCVRHQLCVGKKNDLFLSCSLQGVQNPLSLQQQGQVKNIVLACPLQNTSGGRQPQNVKAVLPCFHW